MRSLFILLLSGCGLTAAAQRTAIDDDAQRPFQTAMTLWWGHRYGAALPLLEQTIEQCELQAPQWNELGLTAAYYRAVCSKVLQHPDAEQHLLKTATERKSPLARRAAFELADLYFSRGQYNKALSWLKKVRVEDLSSSEQDRYWFQAGIGYLHQKDYRQARSCFDRVRHRKGGFYYAANYYYGYITYRQAEYEEAQQALRVAAESPQYAPAVAFYLANIAFVQKRYDEVLTLAANARSSPYAKELNRLVGKTYYAKKDYVKALPFLHEYYQQTPKLPATDIYEVGYCQYASGFCNEALATLQPLTALNDSIGQHAWYLIGECRLRQGQKAEARLAFERAASMKAHRPVQQQALLNYGKLSYELGYADAAIRALQQYLTTDGADAEEARTLLLHAFVATHNYGGALEVARAIGQKTAEWRRAHQRIAYARATELFNEGQYEACLKLLDESLANPVDPSLQAAAWFWKGECAYRLQQPQQAVELLHVFLDLVNPSMKLPGGVAVSYAHYTLGYSYLKLTAYAKALSHFQQSVELMPQHQRALYEDALLRIADCEFVLSNYNRALAAYQEVIRHQLSGADYALFQSAVVRSLLNDRSEQIRLLRMLVQQYPKSNYLDDAWFELGNALLTVPAYQDALEAFQTLVTKYPRSLHVVQARLKMGLIYFNMNRDPDALEQYRWVLQRYPRTPEGSAALNAVKEIFTERGDAQGYMAFVASLPDIKISDAVRDSVMYLSAENKYSRGDCSHAVSEFTNYLQQFPDGIFAVPARFYRAECYVRQNRFVDALSDYEYVINQPAGRFTEKALLQAGRICYQHIQDFPRALNYFLTLSRSPEYKQSAVEARRGAMYAGWQLGDYEVVVSTATQLLLFSQLTEEERAEVYFYRGRAYEQQGFPTQAEEDYRNVGRHTTSVMAAEAAYRIAALYYARQQWASAEEQCWEVIRQKPAHDYWVAKSFLLLAAIYEQQNDLFQASATLQSLIDHYKGQDDIVPEAQRRLQSIREREQAGSKLETGQDVFETQPEGP
ncbi:MAG: tetratricopeptide repeat protein [Chitinophagales bacterium]|nr:tetratricopeptide repeat protein [Chitinophagales bacterium]MDW8428320.1 tetratricopeptide repeat protein [Chitinophagales bacterium]